MKKHFWKIEYSITVFVIFAVVLFMIPGTLVSSKEAAYISRWNETYTKMDYIFTAMKAQEDAEIIKSFKRAKTPQDREQILINLVKPYLRITEQDELTKRYNPLYMNGDKVNKNDTYYFESLYLSQNNIVVGVKDLENKTSYQPGFIMMFDVNGLKAPNKWGKDIYGINIFIDGKITPIGSDWDLEKLKQDCSLKGSGVSCSYYYRIGGEFKE